MKSDKLITAQIFSELFRQLVVYRGNCTKHVNVNRREPTYKLFNVSDCHRVILEVHSTAKQRVKADEAIQRGKTLNCC